MVVANNWNSYGFSGAKRVVLSTGSWLGGANNFIGAAYVTVGSLCMLLSLFFAVLSTSKGRRAGDPAYLSWNRVVRA